MERTREQKIKGPKCQIQKGGIECEKKGKKKKREREKPKKKVKDT